MNQRQPIPSWQAVYLCWGTKYDEDHIRFLDAAIKDRSPSCVRSVLITDRVRDLPESFVQVALPKFYDDDLWRRGGCQAKLAMFQAGVVPSDMPAIFVDLDTLVLGDLGQAFRLADPHKNIQLFQSAILPFSALARFIYRFSEGRIYARGNSSIVVYHPNACGFIDHGFRKHAEDVRHGKFRPGTADERFISWIAQHMVQRLPRSYAVKFPTEFMMHHPWLSILKTQLPWVRRRRNRLAAITLPGDVVKPEDLLSLEQGARRQDNKGRWLVWSKAGLGSIQNVLVKYAKDLRSYRDPATNKNTE